MPGAVVRTFHHRHVDLDAAIAAKRGRTVSVVIPARDEEATVGRIVRSIRRELMEQRRLVDEVIVIDDGSVDGTGAVSEAAGARVVRASEVLPHLPGETGKGEAMWKGLAVSSGEFVVFCDADVRNFGPRFVAGLVAPLLEADDLVFVKAFYDRPLEGDPRFGGRVTELVARPLLSLLFPALTALIQPLAGECAGRRSALEQVRFVTGYGVDIGLVIDLAERFGLEAMAQVDLGVRHHRNRPLEDLAPMAMAVLQTALDRAAISRRTEWSNVLVRPGADPVRVEIRERPPLAQIVDERTA